MQELSKKIIIFVFCFAGHFTQISSSMNSNFSYCSDDSQPLFESSFQNPNIRTNNHWRVEYRGYDESSLTNNSDIPDFKGTREELDLLVSELRNQKKRAFITQRNSLLTDVSKLLEELPCNSQREFVRVKIYDRGDQDYKLNLSYSYDAYDQAQGSFQNENSSRSQDVCSQEQVMSVVKNFVEKHCNELAPKSFESKEQTIFFKDRLHALQKRSRDEEMPFPEKKNRSHLRQLSLDEFFKKDRGVVK